MNLVWNIDMSEFGLILMIFFPYNVFLLLIIKVMVNKIVHFSEFGLILGNLVHFLDIFNTHLMNIMFNKMVHFSYFGLIVKHFWSMV